MALQMGSTSRVKWPHLGQLEGGRCLWGTPVLWASLRCLVRGPMIGGMSGTTSPTHRRSGRAFHKMRLQAQGRAHNGKKFKESCETVVVNAHGGLLMLKHEIDNGEILVLTNPETLEDQECRVVYQGEPCDRGQRIGVEFLTPAPRFWGLEFGEMATPGGGDATAVH
jgi:hypothetical protein